MKIVFLNLKISHKLLLICIAFLLPITAIIYYLVDDMNKDINFAKKEILGTQCIKPISRIIALLPVFQEHHYISTKGGGSFSKEMSNINTEINNSFVTLSEESEALSTFLANDSKSYNDKEFNKTKVQSLQTKWQEIFNLSANPTTDNLQTKIYALYDELQILIRKIGDNSNIVLDPDLDSYYIMDIAIISMPRAMERLRDISTFVLQNASYDTSSIGVKIRATTFTEQIDLVDIKRTKHDVEVSIHADEAYYGISLSLQNNFSKAYYEYENSLNNLKTALESHYLHGQHEAGVSIEKQVSHSIEQVGTFWDQSIIELKILINNRIDYYTTKLIVVMTVSIILLLITILLVLGISRSITRPLNDIIKLAEGIAAGDLESSVINLKSSHYLQSIEKHQKSGKQIHIHNEMLKLVVAFDKMSFSVNSLLNQVVTSVLSVRTSSTQIAASARSLESTVSEQVASTNEVNATSKEISATSIQLASTMNRVTAMSSEAGEVARVGIESLEEIRTTMIDLKDAATEISEKLDLLNQRTANISQVITTIADVANQTNLLSLNAAIEAEKAGKWGAGFSVVAKEIRRLADRTAVATLDVEQIIIEMQQAVSDGVTAMGKYTTQTLSSSSKIARLSDNLNDIIDSILDLGPQFEVANTGMQQQSQAAQQISEAMEQLNIAARTTRDSLSEFKSVTGQLNDAIGNLQAETDSFTVSSKY